MSDKSVSTGRHPFEGLDRKLRAQLRPGVQPTRIEPQLASAVPGDPDPDWVYERKYDGVRLLGFVRDGEVRLRTRKHVPIDDAFPELAVALRENLSSDAVVDGEVVAMENGESTSFSRLQGRLGLGLAARGRPRAEPSRRARPDGRTPRGPAGSQVPVRLYLFDLLFLDGYDLRQLPLEARKRLLVSAVAFEEPIHYSSHRPGDRDELLAEACERGWEGLIVKDPEAPYLAGRSRRWRKLACVRGQELVVGGFTEPTGSRTGFGALLLGYHDEHGEFRYAGKVGTGFDQATLDALGGLLGKLSRQAPPFVDPPADREARWVDPHLVVQVSFVEWTEHGRLRHPRFDGLRLDLDPSEVVREPLG